MMTNLEKNELLIIFLALVGVFSIATKLPASLNGGHLVLLLSILTFIQGLARDLWLLKIYRKTKDVITKKYSQCICVESAIGVTGLALAFVLLGVGISTPVAMPLWKWLVFTLLTLVFGFVTKDLVLEWNPWRIRRDPNHINLVVQWRKPKA